MNGIIIRNWRYEDGWRTIPIVLGGDGDKKEFDVDMLGWFCHVIIDNIESEREFNQWLKENMTGPYDFTFRFNSGNPYYSIRIKENEDAIMFKLRWNI